MNVIRNIRRPRLPRASTVLAGLALFVVLGGSATAATKLISGKSIKNNSVTGKDIKNRSLAKKDLSKKAVKSLKGSKGATGATGATGPKGATGAPGMNGVNGGPGISGLQRVLGNSATDSQSGKTATATCPGTKKVIGSGAELLGDITSGVAPNQIQNVVISNIGIDANSPPSSSRSARTRPTRPQTNGSSSPTPSAPTSPPRGDGPGGARNAPPQPRPGLRPIRGRVEASGDFTRHVPHRCRVGV